MSTYKQLDVGDEVVSFYLESTLGSISMPDIIDGKWSVVVTCAEAFDPVATTDLGILVYFVICLMTYQNYKHIINIQNISLMMNNYVFIQGQNA